MPYDFESLMRENEGALNALLQTVTRAAYEQGMADGLAHAEGSFTSKVAEISRLLDGLKTGIEEETRGTYVITPRFRTRMRPSLEAGVNPARFNEPTFDLSRPPRVRRGLVGQTLTRILTEQPGLTISDYERLVMEAEPAIAVKSIGNELRRGEGERYRRDRPGGYHWYLMDEDVEAEDQLAADTSASSANQGGDDETPVVP